jgi:hypothetical protein
MRGTALPIQPSCLGVKAALPLDYRMNRTSLFIWNPFIKGPVPLGGTANSSPRDRAPPDRAVTILHPTNIA